MQRSYDHLLSVDHQEVAVSAVELDTVGAAAVRDGFGSMATLFRPTACAPILSAPAAADVLALVSSVMADEANASMRLSAESELAAGLIDSVIAAAIDADRFGG